MVGQLIAAAVLGALAALLIEHGGTATFTKMRSVIKKRRTQRTWERDLAAMALEYPHVIGNRYLMTLGEETVEVIVEGFRDTYGSLNLRRVDGAPVPWEVTCFVEDLDPEARAELLRRVNPPKPSFRPVEADEDRLQ